MATGSKRSLFARIRGRLIREFWARYISVLPVSPLSASGGFERGNPIDRLYIERFLEQYKDRVRGRTLEVGDDSYTRTFGGDRVEQADVLDVTASAEVTIVGDLSRIETLPEAAFDCMILTQVIQYIHELPTAVRTIHHALKPGGTALITVPAVSHIVADHWRDRWQWLFTANSLGDLFAPTFGKENVIVQSHGNCFAATTFFYGLAQKDVSRRKLEPFDPSYPIVVTMAVRKSGGDVV
ncbi:methyltransferase domain-containing protein [Rhizobium sp. LjRoot254]|uniref:methyltransferase domain-containing protein n=1 Tax=Rhizobium sp. LjRoot254 TaxID=3342297 RepID=UPI003ECD329F